MYVEIEAKLKVVSFAAVERRLTECGASFVAHNVQIDCYFDTDDRRLTRTDCCLRLRTERTTDRERIILTYKGPKQTDDFKRREEVNLPQTDAAATERFARRLGFLSRAGVRQAALHMGSGWLRGGLGRVTSAGVVRGDRRA